MEEIKNLYKLRIIYTILKENADYMAAFLDDVERYDSIEDVLTEENMQDALEFVNDNLKIVKQYMPWKSYSELFKDIDKR